MSIRSLRAASVLAMVAATPALATVSFQSDFSTFSNGNLVGQGGWTQFGSSATDPVQISNGRAVVPGSSTNIGDDQDAQRTFTAVTNTAGTSFYAGAVINVAQTFALNSSTSGSSFVLALGSTDATPFANLRVVTRQGTAPNTFQFGIRPTGQSGNTFAFGGDLPLGTDIALVLAWDFIAGTQNDTIAAWVNPTSSIRGNNATYVTNTQANATGDAPGFQSFIISQFTNATVTQSGATIGRAAAATEFSEVQGFIPTPATSALVALGGLFAARRRRA